MRIAPRTSRNFLMNPGHHSHQIQLLPLCRQLVAVKKMQDNDWNFIELAAVLAVRNRDIELLRAIATVVDRMMQIGCLDEMCASSPTEAKH